MAAARTMLHPGRDWNGKDGVMAAHGTPEYSVADGNDYPAHEQTYLSFLSLVKWVMGFVIVIVDRDGLFPDLSGRARRHGARTARHERGRPLEAS